jgi:hypothetical protein
MRCVLGSLLVVALLVMPSQAARPRAGEDLMQVVTPTSRGVANAHPFVNVIIAFGSARDGSAADPSTFRAKLNGRDATPLFEPTFTGDVQTGVRATLPAGLLRFVAAPRNKLRLSIQSSRDGGKGGRARDVDRLRFGAQDGPNQAPVAILAAAADAAALGQPVGFDASGSHDPDTDELSFTWTFSDGETAAGPVVTHAFTASDAGVLGATVHVTDGVATVDATATLATVLETDPGRTPGRLRIEATEPLEFSAVALGDRATRTLTVRNLDTTATSQLKVEASVSNGAFSVNPPALDLGPDGSATVDVVFAPTAAGHQDARLMVLASASNRGAVTFLAHGHGGAAPGDGPTELSVPAFAAVGSNLVRLAPDGTRTPIDVTTGTCGPPGSGNVGDVCVVDADCVTPGEVCQPTATPLDSTEICSDDRSLFLLSEDSFTDPRDDPDTELTGSVVRFDLDASGAVTGRRMLYRTTDETTHLACDDIGADVGGLVYLAEFRVVVDTATCERDERDALVSLNKNTGNARTVSGFSRMDAVPGVGECDFRDSVEQLEVARDGVAKYAGFLSHGLWRIAPTPLPFTPDVRDGFQVHPDGSVVFALAHDRGATASIDLYRLTAAQVEHGALPVSTLSPCASFQVPNDTTADKPTATFVSSIVVGASASPPSDASALVTFRTRADASLVDVLPPTGDVRGTVAFSLPSATSTCGVQGLVSVRGNDLTR